jgi:hypothetical protein
MIRGGSSAAVPVIGGRHEEVIVGDLFEIQERLEIVVDGNWVDFWTPARID